MTTIKSPLYHKKLELHNRLIFPPMGTGSANEDGSVNDRLIQYYEERAKDSCLSLIIVEHSYVSLQGKANERQLSVSDDRMCEGLHRLTETIKKHGVKTVLQINHVGAAASSSITGCRVVSSSPIAFGRSGEPAHSLTVDEIRGVVSDFAYAAERAKKSGFDGVEIHSAHSYLLNQFYSPYFNKRSDAYGGDAYGRIRIHLEIIREIRNRVGNDYPLLLRLGACDYIEGGATIEDSIIAAKEFEKAGIDVLDVSGGLYGFNVPGHEREQGWFADVTKAIKQNISIPVVLTGGIRDLNVANQFLSDDAADLIGVGRPIFKDASWGRKAMESL